MTTTAHLGTGTLGAAYLGFGEKYENLSLDRLLQFIRGGPNLRALAGVVGTRTQLFVQLCEDLKSQLDIDTATGDRLDILGSILVLPRFGLSDDDYRIALKIQVLLVLTSTATAETMIQIAELLLGAANVGAYIEAYPMGFWLNVQATDAQATQLLDLLGKARGGAYRYSLRLYNSTTLFGDSVSNPLSSPGILGSVSSAVSGAANLGSVRRPS